MRQAKIQTERDESRLLYAGIHLNNIWLIVWPLNS